MTRLFIRQAASFFLSMLLSCAQAGAQQALAWTPPQGEALVKPDPKKAQKAAELGDKAAAEGKFDAALAFYEEAAHYASQDLAIVGRGAALRSRLVRSHVEAAERDAVDGHMDQATEELGAALRIDPGDTIVKERLAEMQSMAEEPAKEINTEIPGLPKLEPEGGKHSFNLRGDTKTVYEQVAQIFGVRAVFDPDLTSKNVRLRVEDGVDFYTAMSVLGAETATFWRPVDAKLLFVAADTAEKRKQYALEAVQTFALPAATSPEELPDLLRVVRDMTGGTHIDLDKDTRTITMRDTPEKLALAGGLIRELEKARGEMLLEIEILEVDKNKARNLGITPPSGTQLITLSRQELNQIQQSTDLANLLTNIQQVFAAKGFSSIPPVLPFGGGLSTFLLTLPTTTLDLADTLSLVRSGNEVLLRAQDGKPATFFVGDRFPITLSLLSGSGGISGGSLGLPSSTNFPETNFVVGPNPSALVANNFTGGNLPDLAVVFNNPSTHTFTILQNQDNGNFVQFTPAPITLSATETGQVAIGTGVFRNDITKFSSAQPLDVVLVNSTSDNISVLLGNVDANGRANGTFTEATGSPIAVGKNPSALVIADFNGDGFLDIAVANRDDNTISLFKGNGDGTFTPFPGSPFKLTNSAGTAETGPIAMVSGNFRNRLIGGANTGNAPEVDLAVLNQTSSNVSILLSSVDGNGNVTFTESADSPITLEPTSGTSVMPVAMATGDLNADGIPDLAIVTQGNSNPSVAPGITILLGSTNLDGTFTAALGSPLATASTPTGIAIANFAGGAVPDLAVTNQGSSTISIYLGLGQGTFAQRIELNTPTGPTAVITAALSSSGLPDVALLAAGSTANQGDVTVILDSSSLAAAAAAAGAGATNQVPYPGSQFEDLGVKIKATPSLHPNNEVTLQLEFEIRALAGSNVNGIPVLSNRTLSQTVRVKEDEPTLISGLSNTQETRTINGLPGLAQIPGGLGYLFGNRANTREETELLIVITPRRLRRPERKTRTIFSGRGEQGRATNPIGQPSERERTNP
jgi:Bacterial type II and III secretion system protein/FG-GAP-like repeat